MKLGKLKFEVSSRRIKLDVKSLLGNSKIRRQAIAAEKLTQINNN